MICRLRFQVGDEDNPIFDVIRAAESETDRFPVGKERAHWDVAALSSMDRELRDYENVLRPQIVAACEEITQRFADSDYKGQ